MASGDGTIGNMMKYLEEVIITTSFKKQGDLLSKNHDRIISETEAGSKKIDEIISYCSNIHPTYIHHV